MSILSQLFGGSSETTPPPPAVGNTPPTEGQESNGTPELTGMDKFNELINFQQDPDKVAKPFNPDDLLTVDPESLQKEISKMNFIEGTIQKEDAEAITEGGEKALVAMVKVLNNFGQKLYMQNTLASKAIASKTLGNSMTHVDERISKLMRSDKINSSLAQANPALSHPAAAPMIQALIPKIEAKFPGASPDEIKEKATEYFLEFANQLNPKEDPKSKSGSDASTMDWGDWAQTE